MGKGKKDRETITPNSQKKEEQAIIQNPSNPEYKNKRKGKLSD